MDIGKQEEAAEKRKASEEERRLDKEVKEAEKKRQAGYFVSVVHTSIQGR